MRTMGQLHSHYEDAQRRGSILPTEGREVSAAVGTTGLRGPGTGVSSLQPTLSPQPAIRSSGPRLYLNLT